MSAMKGRAVSRGRSRGAAWLVAVALGGCGTVLPPLDELDGAVPVEDTGPAGEDAADGDGVPPDDDDAGETGVPIDARGSDVTTGDGPSDVCRNCTDATDARPDSGVPSDVRTGDADVRTGDADAATCPSPVDCALAPCNGVSCGAHGLICKSAMCACPGAQVKETTCGDGADNDCDGLIDCADPDCARLQCGASTNQRCCGTTCVNTETDSANCQGCGLACASGQTCKRIVDASGTRGACSCLGTTSMCPKYPAQVCRGGNNDGQDNLCACDVEMHGNTGCAEGQVCVDAPGANFCRY